MDAATVSMCPSDIMHIDETIEEQKILNQIFAGSVILGKACPNHAIDVEVTQILLQWVTASE